MKIFSGGIIFQGGRIVFLSVTIVKLDSITGDIIPPLLTHNILVSKRKILLRQEDLPPITGNPGSSNRMTIILPRGRNSFSTQEDFFRRNFILGVFLSVKGIRSKYSFSYLFFKYSSSMPYLKDNTSLNTTNCLIIRIFNII